MLPLKTTQLTPPSGVFIYTVLNGLIGLVVYISGGYLEPREYDLKEYWTWKGTGKAPWFVRACRRRQVDDEPADLSNEEDYAVSPSQSQNPSTSARSHVSSRKGGSIAMTEHAMSPTPGTTTTAGRWVG